MPDCPEIEACACYSDEEWCQCGKSEKALRFVISGTRTLTPEQREWCLQEIDSVEGYDRKNHESDSDVDLARSVLSAWVDYCRDKGML